VPQAEIDIALIAAKSNGNGVGSSTRFAAKLT
jgi:hypothetical protein